MVIKREGKLFKVYKGINSVFQSYDFEECKSWVIKNGGFHESRKKIKEITCKVG